jgi:hypothetical protein
MVDVHSVIRGWVSLLLLFTPPGKSTLALLEMDRLFGRGEVTHLHCKDPFSATLSKLRA